MFFHFRLLTQIALSFFQLISKRALTDIGTLGVVAGSQCGTRVGKTFIHIYKNRGRKKKIKDQPIVTESPKSTTMLKKINLASLL